MNWKGIYSGWIKNYADGSIYVATDIDIQKRKASWRKSENKNIVSVGLKYGLKIVEIYGPGDYWQADQFCVNFPFSETKLLNRNIQKQILPEDKFISIINSFHHFGIEYISATASSSISNNKVSEVILIDDKDIGKWFTLAIDLERNNVKYYISKERL